MDAQSRPLTRLIELVFPDQINHHGTLFGGAALAFMDRAAYIAATRHMRGLVVTARVEQASFLKPVPPGQLAEVTARVSRTGRSSLTVDVELVAEDLLSGARAAAVTGRFVMVERGRAADSMLPPVLACLQDAPAETRFIEVVFPDAANHREILFGGNALSMMGKAAFIAATRHCRRTVVMAASEHIDFRTPIHVGEFAELAARVVMTGRSSMSVEVELVVEHPMTGARQTSAKGRFTMVAVDENGAPVRVPPRSNDFSLHSVHPEGA